MRLSLSLSLGGGCPKRLEERLPVEGTHDVVPHPWLHFIGEAAALQQTLAPSPLFAKLSKDAPPFGQKRMG